jgi:hypothetical protein
MNSINVISSSMACYFIRHLYPLPLRERARVRASEPPSPLSSPSKGRARMILEEASRNPIVRKMPPFGHVHTHSAILK